MALPIEVVPVPSDHQVPSENPLTAYETVTTTGVLNAGVAAGVTVITGSAAPLQSAARVAVLTVMTALFA